MVAASVGLVACATAALLVQQKVSETDFKPMCRGVFQEDAAQKLFPSDEVNSQSPRYGGAVGSQGLLAECKAAAKDKKRLATISIGTAATAPGVVVQANQKPLSNQATSTPLGAGWTGVLTVDGVTAAHATVVMKCRAGERENLLVNVKYDLAGTDTHFSDSAEERLRLAQATTVVARKADEKWKCHAELGKEVRQAPIDMVMSAPKPLSQAAGTCRSLRSIAREARKWGITKAIGTETVADVPAQDCLLVDERGEKVYRLSALYGPLARGYSIAAIIDKVPGKAGRDEETPGWAWSTAPCHGSESAALFTAASLTPPPGEEDRLVVSAAFERKLLDAFGSDLAEQHGCTSPALP
ncbi:hypothetical protein MMF93_11840 [Streptomyces tubbatahanensis]|uniref:Lipoprotein n=1 Tax=Streptomyces tubbatahanensis TaxID=2923272 RepID=A0ABY3XRT8_9ACTN|nr:hypothetical protein [Streptomyces tubbatahanensis]UNS97125.1 hypothetical protein MMF93_11840 [Streptomyces tubbatahanensis]